MPCRLHPRGGQSHCQGHGRGSFCCGPGSDRCVVSLVAGLVVLRNLAPPLQQQPIAVPFSRVLSTRGNGHEHLRTMAKLTLSRSFLISSRLWWSMRSVFGLLRAACAAQSRRPCSNPTVCPATRAPLGVLRLALLAALRRIIGANLMSNSEPSAGRHWTGISQPV